MAAEVLMPQILTISLTVKIGKPHSSSRSSAENTPTIMSYDSVEDSFASLRCRITDRVKAVADRFDTTQAAVKSKATLKYDPDHLILLKPAANTRQSAYTVLNDSNLKPTATTAWQNHTRRANSGGFVLEVFVYLEKEDRNAQQIRRATIPRVAEMAASILAVDRARQPGPSALQYMATTYARQNGVPDFENLPENPTVHQLNRIDDGMETIQQNTAAQRELLSEEYRDIRFRIHGVPCR